MKKNFERKHKEEIPVVAICYDFDKTLSPDDMQAQGYIQSLEYEVPDFWKESNSLAETNDMDQNLAYMYKMKTEAEGRVLFTRNNLEDYGSRVRLFPGVEEWFERIRRYGKKQGVKVEHYIISSGLKEMIEGTSVAKKGAFEKIYASSFYYNERGVAEWPAQVVNYTNKTQFLFRIEKGVLDINDSGVNDPFRPEEIRVPFRNMIYIGDSDTDIPCMKVVTSRGGYAIGVYTKDKTKVHKMIYDGRVKYYAEANYKNGSKLDKLVKAIIDRTAKNEILEIRSYECAKETSKYYKNNSEEHFKKTSLIIALENSRNFAQTHSIIAELSNYHFSDKEKDKLFGIGLKNSQVYYILQYPDINAFYVKLLGEMKDLTENAKYMKTELFGK